MGMTELRETRHRGEESSVMRKLKEAKMLLHEVCEEMEHDEYNERRGYYITEADRYDRDRDREKYDERMSRRSY